jgi:hypothetical protein
MMSRILFTAGLVVVTGLAPNEAHASGGQSQAGEYQQYMKSYASGSQGGNYQQYMKKYAGGEAGGSQGGDYQQYMKKYAGSQGGDYQQYMKKYAGKRGDYQQYMKKYAGKAQGGNYQQYMKKYAGEYDKYSDYQVYIKRYENQLMDQDNVVNRAHDAQNVSQLDAWKDANTQDVQWYVPQEYQRMAHSDVESEYNRRLAELNNQAQSANAGVATDSTDDEVQSAINLVEIPKHATAKQKKALRAEEVEHLRATSEKSVKKTQDYAESLKRASADSKAIENTAAAPVSDVATAFDHRAKELDANIADLQSQVKSKKTNADFANRMHQTMVEVKTIRADELHALEKAHRSSSNAARHAARGVQTEIRHEARTVRKLSDHMAAMNSSYQELANHLQNRAENAADMAETAGEELARRTQQHADDRMSQTRDVVRRAAEHRADAMRQVEGQFKELEAAEAQKSSTTFLAQYADDAQFSSVALLVLVAAVCLSFFVKRNRRTIQTPTSLLG